MSATQTVDADFLPDFPAPIREPRRLQAVPETARRRAPRRLFGVIAVTGALVIVLVQMGLGILTTQSSFEIAALTQQQRDLTYQKQILADDNAGLSSPQYLAANAAALGMVIDESPTYLRLSDGAVIGSNTPSDAVSSVDAMGRGSVRNALIAGKPLVTAPQQAAEPAAAADPAAADPATTDSSTTSQGAAGTTESTTPPAISDGLPTPATR